MSKSNVKTIIFLLIYYLIAFFILKMTLVPILHALDNVDSFRGKLLYEVISLFFGFIFGFILPMSVSNMANKKKEPQDKIYKKIANEIIFFSGIFASDFKKLDVQKSTRIQMEFIYFLLYIIELNLLIKYHNHKYKDKYIDVKYKIIRQVKQQYLSKFLKKGTPKKIETYRSLKIGSEIIHRLKIYGSCKRGLWEKGKMPGQGTVLNALFLFVYYAMGKNTIEQVEAILQKDKIEEIDLEYMPGPDETIERFIVISNLLKDFKIKSYLKNIK